jgi:hypothetical protein
MANPTFQLSRRLIQRYPWLQSQGNRTFLVLGIVVVTTFILFEIGSFRQSNEIADCKAKGGIPIFATKAQEYPSEIYPSATSIGGFKQEYKVFDHCQIKE